MEEKFIKGLFTSRRENSPEFVLASLSFKTEQFIEWLKDHTNSKGYCNVDVLKSKDGVIYSKHNDWQPTGDSEKFVKSGDKIVVEKREEDLGEVMEDEINVDSIPF